MASKKTFVSFLVNFLVSFSMVRGESQYTFAPYTVLCGSYECLGQRVTLQSRTCAVGWSGCKCDIPICTPACTGDQVCIGKPGQKNECGCLGTGSVVNTNCPYAECTQGSHYDCYPGTCGSNLNNCTCPLDKGFAGENCIEIIKAPKIRRCTIEVHSSTNLIQKANCAVDQTNPPVTWINTIDIEYIDAIWTSTYEDIVNLPKVDYIVSSPITIFVTKASVKTTHLERNINNTIICRSASEGTPQTSVDCDVKQYWKDLGTSTPEQKDTVLVTVYAQLGGIKTSTKQGSLPQSFKGTLASRSAVFKFDTVPPVHCLSKNTPDQCPYFAIYLDQDIRTNPTIEPKFYNWTDDDSGIAKFQVAVFKLSANSGLLENVGDALPNSKQDIDPVQNNYIYILTLSGIYSIEVTVYDRAGNTIRARKIFIYNSDSKLTVNPSFPVYLAQAEPSTNYTWLTSFDDPVDGGYIPLTVIWTNHFQSASGYTGDWVTPVKPWQSNSDIDDRFNNTYGRRSISAVAVTNGISSYSVAYTVDGSGGGRGLSPGGWKFLDSKNTSYDLPINDSLPDGSTIVIWVQALDAAFGTVTEKLTIGVDRSFPEVKSQSYKLKTGPFESNSSIYINVVERSSGISKINYRIIVASGTVLALKEAPPKTRNRPAPSQNRTKRDIVTECTPSDKTCYCIPKGDCFDNTQLIEIDNCEIDRFAGQYFEVRYIVISGANRTSVEQTVQFGFLSSGDIPCRASGGLSGGAIAGIVIGTILGFLLLILLIFILCLLVRIYYFKKPVPRRIDNMRKTLRNTIGKSYDDENPAYEPRSRFSAIIKRASVNIKHPKKIDDDDDDEYIYTGSEVIRNNRTHIQRKNLQMDATILSDGRFAVIKKAYLQDGNERKVVAVKALRSGFSAADVKLMEEKIQCLSGIPRHANIVNFLGASEEENNGGPIMILEFCEMPLKEWLKSCNKVTSEILENMLTFTLNIARGVEHLHDNNIIHRRLAARNVLLVQQFGGWVAKLIGFGPNREDSNEDKAKKAAVPVKWLAPETLSTINDIDPTYTEKTDAWSFGITAWEIYSLGEAPYPKKSSSEAKKLIIKGLKPTKPDECPSELYQSPIQPCWETNPNSRPSFSRICSAIEEFRNGHADGRRRDYYTTGDDDNNYGGRDYTEAQEAHGGRAIYDDAR